MHVVPRSLCHLVTSCQSTDTTKPFGPFSSSDDTYNGWARAVQSGLCRVCVPRGRDWITALRVFQLDTAQDWRLFGWGHLSAASRHRQRLGTFSPWPLFSINQDNVLLTLGFVKVALSAVDCSLLFPPAGNESSLAPDGKCRPASRGKDSAEVTNTRRRKNISLTRVCTMAGASQAICLVR